MKSIDVCLSPELIHLYDLEDRTIVVTDILRATSCMVTAFAHGADQILPMSNITDCLKMKQKGYITAGERDGLKVKECDKGNSPFEYMAEEIKGKKIAFTTTNGTLAIEKAKAGKEVVIGAFLNLTALIESIKKSNNSVLVLCAGWKGKVNLEDTLFAGAVVEHLKGYQPYCDAPLAAQHLYLKAKSDLVKFLSDSSHFNRLNKLNIFKDAEFCLTENKYSVVPRLIGNHLSI